MSSDRAVPAPSVSPDFVRHHTRPSRPSLVPEVTLHVAADVVALWGAIEEERGTAPTEPPFWAAAWPGGQALARYVLDEPATVSGRSVLDLGAGSGLVAIAAARAGASDVLASDIDPFSHTAIAVNAEANGVPPVAVLGDVLGMEPPAVDVVLAGDVCYDRVMSERVLPWLEAARARGAEVYLGDPGRPYVPVDRLAAVAVYEVPDTESSPALPTQIRRTTVWRLP
ncbi:putative nicotinamide N-methyase [Blastococcus colisei]|uniref:Putative nicotinamide N-methyase n=1 Tax=Blastococcus colisei TaxID=1564162 RepID=A0A543PEV1_9ACTN|nr:50S ribosomal protein L11 methyltransferase [Blastococcus colisei]TQN42615.1 putative nicotinamide N-methyase [Blastococcus colisei]